MIDPVLAHAGHWLAQVAYVVPLVLVVVALVVTKVRDRRAGDQLGDPEGPRSADGPPRPASGEPT
jgi:hypothetical protein